MEQKTKDAVNKADEDGMKKILEINQRCKNLRANIHEIRMDNEALKVKIETATIIKRQQEILSKYVAAKKRIVNQFETLADFIRKQQENFLVAGFDVSSEEELKGNSLVNYYLPFVNN